MIRFSDVRNRVTAQEAAQFYGLQFDRQGKALCPFHQDHHPSMSFRNGRFRCWACGATGDSIDFTSRFLGLTPFEATRRLNDDFHLGLPVDRQQTPLERTEAVKAAVARRELSDTSEAFESWRNAMLDKLTAVFRMAHLALKDCQTLDDLTEAETLAVKWQAAVGYWADCLLFGDMAEQMDIFRSRKEVEQICNRVLNNTPKKFGAA